MKKSILCFTLLLAFSFGCNKGTEPQITESQSSPDKSTVVQAPAEDRALCCCDLIVSSTTFGGLTICGAINFVNPGNPCSISTTCGDTCGEEMVVTPLDRDVEICYKTDCPICFTNDSGVFAIQIQLGCDVLTGPIDLDPGETRCFLSDCNGNLVECF